MVSFGLLFRLTFQLLVRSDPRMNRWSFRRLGVFLFLLFVFLPLQACHLVALGVDRLLFRFNRIEPVRPLFVVGVPRSGTTFLHRLLALDQPHLTTFSLWELLFAPAICQKLFWLGIGKVDSWVGRPLFRLVRLTERLVLGKLDSVHGTSLFDPEEDYLALMPFAGCFLLVHLFPFSDEIWRLVDCDNNEENRKNEGRLAKEITQLTEVYRGLVQRHLYVFGPEKIFLSKNPSFTPWIPQLSKSFPDARFIGCFRDPCAAIPSLLSSMEAGAKLTGNQNNTDFHSALVDMAKSFYYRLLIEYRDFENLKLVEFGALTGNPRQCLQEISEELELKSLVFHEKLEKACLTATNYNSKHRYDAGQFGLDINEIKLDLGFVFEAIEQKRIAKPPTL